MQVESPTWQLILEKSGPMTGYIQRVSNASEAETVINYFNGFHDGFIKQLVLGSQDEFTARGIQQQSGNLELSLTLAHYNYQQDTRPHDQLILARFSQVRDLAAKFSGRSYEWAIYSLTIHEMTRSDHLGQTRPCLKIVLTQSYLQESTPPGKPFWTQREDLVFTCAQGEFTEL